MVNFAKRPQQSTPDERTGLAVGAAIRAFRDRSKAADWLGAPNAAFDGRAPLLIAKESDIGCARVCKVLDALAGLRPEMGHGRGRR